MFFSIPPFFLFLLYLTSYTHLSLDTLFSPSLASPTLNCSLMSPSLIPYLSSNSDFFPAYHCLHPLLPCPFGSLPAQRMCAALHGQRAPRPISSQSPGNARKLPNTYSRRRGGDDWWLFREETVEKKSPEPDGGLGFLSNFPTMQLF